MENWVWLYFLPENCLGLSLGHLVHQLVLPRALLAASCWSHSWCPLRRRRPAPWARSLSTAQPDLKMRPPRLPPLAPSQDPPQVPSTAVPPGAAGEERRALSKAQATRGGGTQPFRRRGKVCAPGSASYTTRSRTLRFLSGSFSGSPVSWEPLGPPGDPTLRAPAPVPAAPRADPCLSASSRSAVSSGAALLHPPARRREPGEAAGGQVRGCRAGGGGWGADLGA